MKSSGPSCSVTCSLIYVPWPHCAVPHYSTYYTLLWTSECLSPSPEDKESCLLHLYIPGGVQYANVARIKESVYLVTFMYFLCEGRLIAFTFVLCLSDRDASNFYVAVVCCRLGFLRSKLWDENLHVASWSVLESLSVKRGGKKQDWTEGGVRLQNNHQNSIS